MPGLPGTALAHAGAGADVGTAAAQGQATASQACTHCGHHHHPSTFTGCQRLGSRVGMWNPCCQCMFSALGDDLLSHLLSFLGLVDRTRHSGVCTRWFYLLNSKSMWTSLDLSRAAAHTPGISALASVPVHAEVLRKLRLAVPHLDDREFPEAHIVDAPLPKLQSLDLGGSSAVDGSTVQSLVAGTRVLRRLNLGGVVQLTDADLARIIPAAQNLRFLSLRDVRLMTDASLRLIAQAAPSLLELNLTGCYNISAAAVAELLACSRQRLRHLHLRGTKACTGQVLVALAAHAPQLLELDVSSDDVMLGSEEVKDEHVAALVGGCGGLQSLAVQGQVALSDAKFAAAVSTLRGLRHLDVSGADGLGRHTVQAVAFSCPELRSLRLNATAATDASIASLSSCRRLEVLDVAQCDGVSVRAVAALADATPSLSHVLAGGCQGSHLSRDAIHEHFKKRSVVFGHPDAGYAGRAAAGGGKAPGTLFVELV